MSTLLSTNSRIESDHDSFDVQENTNCCACCAGFILLTTRREKRQIRELMASARDCAMCALIYNGIDEVINHQLHTIAEKEGTMIGLRDMLQTFVLIEGYERPDSTNPKDDEGRTGINANLVVDHNLWEHFPDLSLDSIWVFFVVVSMRDKRRHRAYWSSPIPIDFQSRLTTVLDWISECNTQHGATCVHGEDIKIPAAARLMEISSQKDKITIRLVSTTDVGFVSAPYVVLSHCWGNIDPKCKTTNANVTNYLDGISLQTLPPTFSDAIMITHALGVRYLWIDSLCIIQDNREDWKKEAVKMSDIFRDAYLTISATGSSDCHGGCGIETAIEPSTVLHIRGKKEKFWVRIGKLDGIKYEFEDSALHDRAWIFQEKLLSRRIVHFCQRQLVWQCRACIESEDGLGYAHHTDTPVEMGTFSGRSRWHCLDSHLSTAENDTDSLRMIWLWWIWVSDFTDRKLTHTTDNYPALSGVVRLFEGLTKDKPVVGLWKKDLDIHLVWNVRRPYTLPAALSKSHGPSWNWMSYQHGSALITGPFLPIEKNFSFMYRAQVEVINLAWEGKEWASYPIECSLRITGKFIRIHLPMTLYEDGLHRKINNIGPGRWDTCFLDPEMADAEAATTEFHAVAMYAYKGYEMDFPQDKTSSLIEHLVVKRTDESKPAYIRIGVLHRQWSGGPEVESILAEYEDRTITLV
ncbi:heterokaryon incompatibility protein-domain-containing protein [Dendryphion nanum]|uniref:Heterokaryon incompatibility protein-domain-containing protein n=1 Tax=Dendryphion nanum TaxID=256645 RepID=A0A9P9ILD3_9PLEO|nr:heterokaryon incompatibility protein-domain-containing protein [Dendryphion nanum]